MLFFLPLRSRYFCGLRCSVIAKALHGFSENFRASPKAHVSSNNARCCWEGVFGLYIYRSITAQFLHFWWRIVASTCHAQPVLPLVQSHAWTSQSTMFHIPSWYHMEPNATVLWISTSQSKPASAALVLGVRRYYTEWDFQRLLAGHIFSRELKVCCGPIDPHLSLVLHMLLQMSELHLTSGK